MKYQESNRLEAACNAVQESINTHIKMLDDEIKKYNKIYKLILGIIVSFRWSSLDNYFPFTLS